MRVDDFLTAVKNASKTEKPDTRLLVDVETLVSVVEVIDDMVELLAIKDSRMKLIQAKYEIADQLVNELMELEKRKVADNNCLDSQKSELLDEYV